MAWFRREQSAGFGFDDDEGSRFAQPGFIASALVILFVIICAAYVMIGGSGGGKSRPDAQKPPQAPPAATLGPVDLPRDPDAPCPHIATTGERLLTRAPADVEWISFRTVLVPMSRTVGPAVVQGDVARCYAQTPTGALLATAQITARYFLAENWPRVVKKQVASGPGAEAYENQRYAAELSRGAAPAPVPGTIPQITGFKFVNYNADGAVVELARRLPDGTLQAFVHTVVWREGDWKLQLGPDGSDSTSGQQLTSLEGFVPWGGA